MAHTFANLLTHVIFSTKNRVPLLSPDLRADMLDYSGGIIRKLHGKVIESNARPENVHCLLSLPPALSVAEALREQLVVVGARDSPPADLRLADRLRRVQREPVQRSGGREIYS